MNLYVVRDWKTHYEVSQSRKVHKTLSWVALPCKHDGLGFRRIMALPDGPQVYGAWVLIVQVAAKCSPRGRLADERGPITAEELSFKTGCPQKFFERAIEVVSSERVGWLLVEKWERAGSELPLQDRTGQDITEQDKTDTSDDADGPPPELLSWIDWWNDLKAQGLVAAGVSREPISDDVKRGWKRVCETKAVRQLLADREVLAKEILACAFLREGWFTLGKLLGGKNRDGAYIVQRIVDGGYRDGRGRGKQSAGKQYRREAECDFA